MVGTRAGDNVGDIHRVAKRVATEGLPQSMFLLGGVVGLALIPTLALKVRQVVSRMLLRGVHVWIEGDHELRLTDAEIGDQGDRFVTITVLTVQTSLSGRCDMPSSTIGLSGFSFRFT